MDASFFSRKFSNTDISFLNFIYLLFFIEVQLTYNGLVSGVQHSDSVIYIYTYIYVYIYMCVYIYYFSDSFPF